MEIFLILTHAVESLSHKSIDLLLKDIALHRWSNNILGMFDVPLFFKKTKKKRT